MGNIETSHQIRNYWILDWRESLSIYESVGVRQGLIEVFGFRGEGRGILSVFIERDLVWQQVSDYSCPFFLRNLSKIEWIKVTRRLFNCPVSDKVFLEKLWTLHCLWQEPSLIDFHVLCPFRDGSLRILDHVCTFPYSSKVRVYCHISFLHSITLFLSNLNVPD